LKNLIHEIHRRSLWQVVGIYLAGGWLALQVVEQLAEAAGLPEWIRPLTLALLIVGFPIVVATAFVQEGMGARGVEPEPQSPADVGVDVGEKPPSLPVAPTGAASVFTWRNAIMGGIGAVTIWGLVALVWVLRGGVQAVPVEGSLPGAASPLQARVAAIAGRVGEDLPTVAVLPFEDSGSEDEYAFFADGVHEDLLTNLSKVRGLIVLARPTVMPYRESELPVQQIAEELGATALVSGSVRRAQGKVRINVQLIDPATNATLWAERYDRDLDDIFAVQSEIAFAVTAALETSLSPEEEVRLAAVPTEDIAAFDLYTRARQAYDEYSSEANERAIRLFREAIQRDPGYGLAWAGLSDAFAQSVLVWGAGLQWADSAIAVGSRAVELAPEASEAHKALGLAYWALGRSAEAVAANERALDLNPSNSDAANNLAAVYQGLGRPADAIPQYRLSERLRPHVFTRTNLGLVFASLGFSGQARELAARDREIAGKNAYNLNILALVALSEQDYPAMLDLAAQATELAPANLQMVAGAAARAFLAGDVDQAERYARAVLDSESGGRSWGLLVHNANTTLGEVALARGDTTAARQFLRNSLDQEEEVERRGVDDVWLHHEKSLVYAALDEREPAIEEALAAYERGAIYPLFWDPEPAFDLIRDDPRFRDMRARAQARFDAERVKIAEQEGIPLPEGR